MKNHHIIQPKFPPKLIKGFYFEITSITWCKWTQQGRGNLWSQTPSGQYIRDFRLAKIQRKVWPTWGQTTLVYVWRRGPGERVSWPGNLERFYDSCTKICAFDRRLFSPPEIVEKWNWDCFAVRTSDKSRLVAINFISLQAVNSY